MTDDKNSGYKFQQYVYRCPHEGANCIGGKHCYILETTQKIPCPLTALVKCPVQNNAKIEVVIGA